MSTALAIPDISMYVDEVSRRGGETRIVGRYETETLSLTHEWSGLVLLTASGWRQYSRAFGARRASLAYLCGYDDAGIFAVRVSATCKTVQAALDFLTPRTVKAALEAGRRVLRQGDVYAVECGDRRDRAEASAAMLPAGHEWHPETRYLVHRPEVGGRHKPIKVSFPACFVTQVTYRMGRLRNRRTGRAD